MSNAEMHQDSAGEPRACQACSEAFKPARRWQRFCSPACRKSYNAKMTPEALRRDLDELREKVSKLVRERPQPITVHFPGEVTPESLRELLEQLQSEMGKPVRP